MGILRTVGHRALRHYASGLVELVEPLPSAGSHRLQLLTAAAAAIDAVIAREGCFRVLKRSGCFVADLL